MIAAALTTALTLPAATAGWYLAPMAARRWQERRLRRTCAQHGILVLTYDDGPGEHLTPKLLDLLASHDARATFFLAGFRAAQWPGVVDQVVEAGHEVGCHGHEHVNAWRSSPRRGVMDVIAGYDALSRWVPGNGLFRPPHGKLTLATWATLHTRRAPLGWWTIPGGDVMDPPPDVGYAQRKAHEANGGVVLMHDFDHSPARETFVLEATRQLLNAADQHGWSVQTLGELLNVETRRAA